MDHVSYKIGMYLAHHVDHSKRTASGGTQWFITFLFGRQTIDAFVEYALDTHFVAT